MPQATQYEVVAKFSAKGDLQKRVNQMTRGLPVMNRQLQRAAGYTRNLGRTIEGTAARSFASWGATGAKVAGVGATLAGGMLIRGGLRFNKVMEDTRLQAATMFQMFKLSEGQLGKNATQGEKWAQNLENAKFVMQGLFEVAKKTPASFQQVTMTYKGMAAGITLATKDLTRQLKFMESVSLLGSLAGGDYTVLGAQMGRILAGSAGAEMNIWKVISQPIMEAGKSMKLFKKEMTLGADVTKAFNELASPERLRILERAMSEFGEEMKTAYAESMAGIVSTTESQLQVLMGMGTKPLYEGFRGWLVQLNRSNKAMTVLGRQSAQMLGGGTDFGQGPLRSRREGLFSDYNMKRWSVLFNTLGMQLGRLGQRMMDGLERAGFYLLDNWPQMMETFRSAWTYGVAAFRAMLAVMLTRMMVGRGLAVAGAGVGAATGAMSGIMKVLGLAMGGGKRGFQYARSRQAGPMSIMEVISRPFTALFRGLKPFLSALAVFAVILVPLVGVIVALGIALAGLSVLAASIAVYITVHWKELMDAVTSGQVTFDKFRDGAKTLWGTLLKIGETLLGGEGPVDTLQKALNALGETMVWLARQMGPVLASFADVLRIEHARNKVNAVGADLLNVTGYAPVWAKEYREREQWTGRMIELLDNLAKVGTAEAEKQVSQQQRATLAVARMRAQGLAQDQQQRKGEPKGTEVKIQNVIVNQDLRGLDPDRVFASFLPALEKVARDKTTAVSQLAFGA